MSSNSKDIIQINRNKVPVRFMKMLVLDTFRLFDKRFPGLVGRTTFFSSLAHDVKILSPHDTCIFIVHKHLGMLIKVCTYFLSSIYNLRLL